MLLRRSVRTVVRSGVVAAAAVGTLCGGVSGPADATTAAPAGDDAATLDAPGGFGVDGTSGNHRLSGVAAIASDDVMAVGSGGDDLSTRAPHWDGDRWEGTRPPVGFLSEMWGVAAISSTDVWGVGNLSRRSLAAHWDGSDWTQVKTPSPDDDSETDYLSGVAAAASDDVWAVGFSRLNFGGNETEPLILHWNGTKWAKSTYELPPGHVYGSLGAVTVISPTDAWAVGFSTGGLMMPLMLHWDGRSWEPSDPYVRSALSESVDGLRAVDAVASDDVWASGYGGGDALLHWNGEVWTHIPPPRSEQRGSAVNLYGLAAVASDDVWAVGGYDGAPYYDYTRILHWDGTSWTEVKSPNPGSDGNELRAVSAVTPDDIWAVGRFNNKPDAYRHLFVHWDGNRWTRVRANGG